MYSYALRHACNRTRCRSTQSPPYFLARSNEKEMAPLMAAQSKALSAQTSTSAFQNPFAGHRQLSEKEQEVLGEYARLAATIRRIAILSSSLASNERHSELLTDLRILERKMGLVLTLFKASVWSLIQTHQDDVGQQ